MKNLEKETPGGGGCGCGAPGGFRPLPMAGPVPEASGEACCGPPPGPPSSPMERPGYKLESFVEAFLETPAGPVPRVSTKMSRVDWRGEFLARATSARNDYKVAPGLYAVGDPDEGSPVLVTANYKLTFDGLRRNLCGVNAWLLVLDTRGVNVWCSAGKGLFGTREVIDRARLVGLERVVSHRKLILPQLSATGVSAVEVKRGCGFEVVWGPVRARDVRPFIEAGARADEEMRKVTFSLAERLVLTPIELSGIKKPVFWILIALFILSGIGDGWFSFARAWDRGLIAALALLSGIVSGVFLGPALLPVLPWPSFSAKGAATGLIGAIFILLVTRGTPGWLGSAALVLFVLAVSSHLTMNFTGSTPYTSPTGVEKEMRRFLPLQAAAVLLATVGWIAAGFAG